MILPLISHVERFSRICIISCKYWFTLSMFIAMRLLVTNSLEMAANISAATSLWHLGFYAYLQNTPLLVTHTSPCHTSHQNVHKFPGWILDCTFPFRCASLPRTHCLARSNFSATGSWSPVKRDPWERDFPVLQMAISIPLPMWNERGLFMAIKSLISQFSKLISVYMYFRIL